ncbi:MAG: tetratricopeptide repeat protein [Vicingaceae bacterium]|nr:tetratricopeptide repeat protein [Vicingaceae bacterium]
MTGLEKGKALFEKQEFNEAIIELDIFLAQQKNNADALYTRAICYRKIDQFEKSIEDLTAILERLPEEATLLCDRGISHFKNKNIEAAMLDMNKAVELEPENPFRYSSRAYIRAKTDIKGAMADYEKAIELDPKDEISYNNLGLLQENAGRMKSAKKNFSKGNDIIGYDPDKRQEDIDKSIEKIDDIKEKEKLKNPHQQESVWKIMLQVFTSKKTRQEYFNFLKSKFRRTA